MRLRFAIHLLGLILSLGTAIPAAAQEPGRPDTYPEVLWDSLVPLSWHPEKIFEGINIDEIPDGDPRLDGVIEKLAEEWSKAPANPAMDGKYVKIPGFVAPLDWSAFNELKEFLLVPYFGACIHSPPPPANQIIYVKVDRPLKEVQAMAPVWVYGRLIVETTDSDDMGVSSYSMDAERVLMYEDEFKD